MVQKPSNRDKQKALTLRLSPSLYALIAARADKDGITPTRFLRECAISRLAYLAGLEAGAFGTAFTAAENEAFQARVSLALDAMHEDDQ